MPEPIVPDAKKVPHLILSVPDDTSPEFLSGITTLSFTSSADNAWSGKNPYARFLFDCPITVGSPKSSFTPIKCLYSWISEPEGLQCVLLSTFQLDDVCIDLKARGTSNYGTGWVDIGIPQETAAALLASLGKDQTFQVSYGEIQHSTRKKYTWVVASLTKSNKRVDKLEMIISEGDSGSAVNEKKEFNRRHRSCRDVVTDPMCSNYYKCNLIVEPYGSNVPPSGLQPDQPSDFIMEIKFRIREVLILNNNV